MSTKPPHEPTAPVKPATRGRGDTPPPAPPHELSHETFVREFEHEGTRWIARLGGKGACGTGSYGLGLVEAVHFLPADSPGRPLREALIPFGRFEGLFPAELVQLLATSRPIPPAE